MGMELINHNAGKGDCIQIRYTGESRTCHNIIVDTGVLQFGPQLLMATLDGNTKTLLPVSELPCILSLIQ